jgi:NADH-quinone oxidoreductase subunit J
MFDTSLVVNWVFLVFAVVALLGAGLVVLSRNLIHAALGLAATLASSAALFLILGAEFVAWVVILVYVGAVIVLFLFGIMITRAPIGREVSLDNERRGIAALTALILFATLAWASISAFGDVQLTGIGEGTSTDTIAEAIFGRFVLPFEIVSFVLLAALIGGIVLARRDTTPAEEQGSSV